MKSSENHRTLAGSWSLLPKSAALVQQYFVPLLYVTILPSLLLTLSSVSAFGRTNRMVNGHVVTNYAAGSQVGHSALSVSLFIIGLLWALLSMAAHYYIQLRAVDGKPVDIAEMYRKTAKQILPILGLVIVYGLIVGVGLVLLVVPGFIFLRRYCLSPYYLIERGVSIREALRLSAAATKPIAGYIWGVFGVTLVLAVVAVVLRRVPLGIGVVLATLVNVLYSFALAFRYKEVRLGLLPPKKAEWSTVEH